MTDSLPPVLRWKLDDLRGFASELSPTEGERMFSLLEQLEDRLTQYAEQVQSIASETSELIHLVRHREFEDHCRSHEFAQLTEQTITAIRANHSWATLVLLLLALCHNEPGE